MIRLPLAGPAPVEVTGIPVSATVGPGGALWISELGSGLATADVSTFPGAPLDTLLAETGIGVGVLFSCAGLTAPEEGDDVLGVTKGWDGVATGLAVGWVSDDVGAAV